MIENLETFRPEAKLVITMLFGGLSMVSVVCGVLYKDLRSMTKQNTEADKENAKAYLEAPRSPGYDA